MATSFRLPPEHITRLELLAKRLGQSKAQVVKLAIDILYERELKKKGKTIWDRLTEGGFESQELNLGNLADDENKQRALIRARLAKKHRR